ncbi:peptidase inhibitor family I36 protein [Streptomyces sp. NPDC054961]
MTKHRTLGTTASWKVVVALLMTFFASAATMSAADAAVTGGGRPDFSAQAAGLGLDGTQARSLQNEADGYLARMGGTQVSADKIVLPGGRGELLLPLPGESRPRHAAPVGEEASLAGPCPYTYVCAFSGPDFTGVEIRLFSCNTMTEIPWSDTGSWINNQRSALHAKFYDVNRNLGWTSPGGYSEDRNAPWGWVWYLSPC